MSDAAPPTPPWTKPRTPLRLPSRLLVLDLFTSYGVNLARAGSMLAIVALLGHRTTTGYLAAFLFLRAMIGLLNNLFAGAQPAALAALRLKPVLRAGDTQPAAPPEWSALLVANLAAAAVMLIAVFFCIPPLRAATAPLIPPEQIDVVAGFTLFFTIGLLARLTSDAAGGVLQARRLLWLDNSLVAGGEILWVILAFLHWNAPHETLFGQVALTYFTSGAVLFLARWTCAATLPIRFDDWWHLRLDVAWKFLAVAGVLAFASLGDFLFAPMNNLIINRCVDPLLTAAYGPALQVDALLLLVVSGIASVMLPRVVTLQQRNDFDGLRRAYLGTHIAGTFLLLGCASLFLTFSGPILKIWLGDIPPGTRAILPFVLVHTVVGGTGSIGRAVLLGIGKFKAWTIMSLGGGVAHAILAFLFAAVFGWGLRGIVCATILVVTVRTAICMPWFILHSLKKAELEAATLSTQRNAEATPAAH